jgi:charged multivesicular body protein 2A
MNLPALQRIAMEFERENDIMDQRQEMMDDAIDDMTGVDEEEESDEVVEQVLEEIGVDLRQAVSDLQCERNWTSLADMNARWARHLRGYRAVPLQKAGSRKLLGAVLVVETQEMLISKLDLTA